MAETLRCQKVMQKIGHAQQIMQKVGHWVCVVNQIKIPPNNTCFSLAAWVACVAA